MKLEIAESLALSYLKHVHRCVFYQNNWKPSGQWERFNEEEVEDLFNRISTDPELAGVCKQTSDYSQFLRQAEIDAIGLDISGTVYAIDTAFHENGLNYGSSEETANRIMKKLLRAYLIIRTYFPNSRAKVIFASPKVTPAKEELIKHVFSRIPYIVEDNSVEFLYFSNKKFKEELIDNVIKYGAEDSDTAELFLRAMRLYELWEPRDKIQKSPRAKAQQALDADTEPIARVPFDRFLELRPADEKLFKEKLLAVKRAKRTWVYADGRQVQDTWKVRNMSPESNLRGNIASNNKVKDREEYGFVKLIIEIEE